jgi:hypothetical protein
MTTNRATIDRLMNIFSNIQGGGGCDFLKIRACFDDLDRIAAEGDSRAIQIQREVERLEKIIDKILENPL